MNCPDCGSPVEKQAQFCPKCYARIEPPSLWQKFLSLFQRSGEPRRPLLTIKKTVTIKTNKDGERHEYNSLENGKAGSGSGESSFQRLIIVGRGQPQIRDKENRFVIQGERRVRP